MKSKWIYSSIVCALLLPLFFIFHGFVQYHQFIPASSFFKLGSAYLIAGLALLFLFGLFYKNVRKAGVAVFVFFLFFCFFGAVHDVLKGLFGQAFLVRYIFLGPALALAFVFILWWIDRRVISRRMVLYLNSVLALLLLIDAVTFLVQANGYQVRDVLPTNHLPNVKPDVHFIVVDGYAGTRQLAEDFSVINQPFLDSLEKLGFYVMKNSSSNYTRTEFSMASMLNMQYHSLPSYVVTDESLKYCFKLIAKNKVVQTFEQYGYEVVNNSIFDIGNAASPVKNAFLVKGTDLIESETLLARLRRDVYIPFLLRYLKKTSLYKDHLFHAYYSDSVLQSRLLNPSKPVSNHPRFIYTHFLMAHFPYYFKENGQLNEPDNIRLDNYEDKALYLGNLNNANTRLLKIIRQIFAASKRPTAILLISDHGFRYSDKSYNAFSNLSAVYLPNKNYELYNDSLTLVNQFRVLANTLFQERLPLLTDRIGESAQMDNRK